MAFGGFSDQNSQAPMSEINTTPLVDVMLVLLIIFMITAPLITNSVNVNLPGTKTAATPDKPDVINISINDKGKLFWNETSIQDSELATKLSSATATKDKSQVELHLRADKNTTYEKITQVMTEVQKAGITKLGFISHAEGE